MTEAEKKEEIKAEEAAKPQEPAQATPAAAPVAAPAAAPATAEKKKDDAPAYKSGKNSRPKACTKCGKPLKKKTWYYRNGKYFCNKRCWKISTKPKEPKAA